MIEAVIVILIVLVVGGFLLVAAVGSQAGAAAAAVTALVLVGIAVLIVASLISAARRRKAAAEVVETEGLSEWAQWVVSFPDDVQHAVKILSDHVFASEMWPALGLGTKPNLARGEPGEYPVLAPSRNSYPPDEGIVPVRVGIRVRLRMPYGHKSEDYAQRASELASALNADSVRVVGEEKGLICLDVRVRDPLAFPERVPEPEYPVDLNRANVGRVENGDEWRTPVIYRNRLTVGVMGAGKSGFLRSVLMATAPVARDGLIVNLMIDCKFGIEAAAARGLLHGVAGDERRALVMLEWLWNEVIVPRGRYMEAHRIDKHVPTLAEPLYRVYVDELAELLDNPDLAKDLQRMLRKIMRVGRALGVTVDGFSQDPSKDTLGKVRSLFHIRAGLRLTSDEELGMVYGDRSAASRGADNTTIPDQGSEGVGYVVEEGSKAIVRVRAYEVTVEDMDWAAAMYPPYPHEVPDFLNPDLAGDEVVDAVVESSASRAALSAVPAREREEGWASGRAAEVVVRGPWQRETPDAPPDLSFFDDAEADEFADLEGVAEPLDG